MFAYLENEAGLSQMGMGDEWKVGWRVVFRGLLYISARVTVSLGHWRGEWGLVPPSKHLVPDKDQQLRMHLAN